MYHMVKRKGELKGQSFSRVPSLLLMSYPSDEEDSPYVLAPKPQRLGIASGLVAVGVGISAAMCLYPWRYINRLSLLKGGNMVRLETCAKGLASHKVKEYPINKLAASQRVYTGVGPRGTDAINSTSSYVFLRSERERMGYILDRKGNYLDPRIFDGLFQR
ncbi:hypothetical protein K450DRAFT_258556 [Umbelopsis ramanniana AG]|uniref:Uncharacterized protein n=1 Tax=Umbelopsis ramanniana AG TaxID=1314678 RepID=A0AAD5E3N6_UMBRA|nr:uncharacterized protein K450DRAFT_258556 [Umbelopsis ramanniana AG]KAI8576117.1 hypothetical protein K450DRAFT_258556 [Umbelopsis ramanniana AG]